MRHMCSCRREVPVFVEEIFPRPSLVCEMIHNDHLATPQKMTDSSGTLVWAADYRPFGEATIDQPATITNSFRFPGQFFDAETGLNYNSFRDYDPDIGRYSEADPLGLYGEGNLYLYVAGNPLNAGDLFGLSENKDCSYYQNVCMQHPTLYYCFTVQFVCKNWPDKKMDDLLDKNGWSGCVRSCLQDFDKTYHCADTQNCQRLILFPLSEPMVQSGFEPCAIGAHAYCFTKCYQDTPN
jgi:RHS repeat-associated protein